MSQNETHAFPRRAGLAALAAAVAGGTAGAAGWHLAASPAAASQGAGPRAAQPGDLIAGWSLAAHQAIRAKDGYRDPLAASRVLAMMHLAMHDAANAAAPRFATWLPVSTGQGGDPAVAAAVAAHDVLRAFCPDQRDALQFELDKTLLEAGRGEAAARGRTLGATVAALMLAARTGDGADRAMRYAPMNHVGAYRYTPGFDFLFAPQWRAVRPFALQSPAQFRVPAPPSVESAAYARAFEEVKRLGGKHSGARTEEQTRIAHFWYEFSDIGWNRVARVVARDRALDLWDAARLFALVNMALADACGVGFQDPPRFLAPGDGDPQRGCRQGCADRRRARRRRGRPDAGAAAGAHPADALRRLRLRSAPRRLVRPVRPVAPGGPTRRLPAELPLGPGAPGSVVAEGTPPRA
jgi:hypothetical protein